MAGAELPVESQENVGAVVRNRSLRHEAVVGGIIRPQQVRNEELRGGRKLALRNLVSRKLEAGHRIVDSRVAEIPGEQRGVDRERIEKLLSADPRVLVAEEVECLVLLDGAAHAAAELIAAEFRTVVGEGVARV